MTILTAYQAANQEAALKLGSQSLKNLELINGGAAVGILTFYGGFVTKGDLSGFNVHALTLALSWFVEGVITAAVAVGLAYVGSAVNVFYALSAKFDLALRIVGAAIGLMSLICFVAGLNSALPFFLGEAKPPTTQMSYDDTYAALFTE